MKNRCRRTSDASLLFSRLLVAIFSVCWVALSQVSFAGDAPFAPPFYFAAPRSAWGEQPAFHHGALDGVDALVLEAGAKGIPTVPAGLRYIVVRDSTEVRDSIARTLYAKNLLADGDVVLTFRPSWANTMAYPHIQMGISHSGVIYTRGNRAYNLDLPLNEESNGSFDSELNSARYKNAAALHVLRPRNFDIKEREAFSSHVRDVIRNATVIGRRELLPSNLDFLSPRYFALHISPVESVKRFHAIITSPEAVQSPMPMYCSEFVWHMHSLNGASEQRPKLIFNPMKFVSTDEGIGLGEGPLAVLRSAGDNLTAEQKSRLIDAMFVENEAPQLSPGHRETARMVRPLMGQLEHYYRIRLLGSDAPDSRVALANALNESVPANYSPTAFFINSFLPAENPERKFDYLYTLLYVSDSDFEQARSTMSAR